MILFKHLIRGLIGLMFLMHPVVAQERIALVVGNGAYTSVSPLANPVSDARLISATLAALDFDVRLHTDATQAELKVAISQFGRDLRAAGPETVGLFYYAGHGVQSFGTNYFLPVDAAPLDAADLDLVALEASSVLRQMASARNRTNIVILDACRNNPFETVPSLNDNGLAEMKAPTGTYLAYATAPGSVSFDGVGGNSPFTAALATAMQVEGLPIEKVFKDVRVSVLKTTKGAQTPWDTSSLTGDFVFKAGVKLTAEQVAEKQLWQSVAASGDPVQIILFMRTYPGGLFENEARHLLSDIVRSELLSEEPEKVDTAVAAPQKVTPTANEEQLMSAAQASGTIEDYQAYLDAFPDGVFAELARFEIGTIIAKINKDTDGASPDAGQQQAALEPEATPGEPEVSFDGLDISYNVPLTRGAAVIVGSSIEELILKTPSFSPIEGIPEELWKDQNCSNCHSWTQEALCTQGETYKNASGERALGKEHPFGGSFKQTLRVWAAGGCK